MSAFFTQGLTEMWVSCGTKFGKTISGASGLVGRAAVTPGSLFRWVAPIYSQTKIGFRYCQRVLPGSPYTEINKSEPSITLLHNDSRIEFRSGRFAEDLEGEACMGYVLDECAKMDEQVYDSAKTTTTITRGPLLAISTPRGKNWFYTRCMQAKEEMEWSLKRGEAPTKIFLTAPSIENPSVTADAIEEAKRSLPDRLFRQYYLAEFVEDGSVFVGFRESLYGPPLQLGEERQTWVSDNANDRTVVIGADWAKATDYTVFIAIDIKENKVVGFDRFHRCPYTEGVRRLVHFAKRFGDVEVVLHDKTGVGQAIDDQLDHTSLPAEGITFSNASKSEMVTRLITTLEQKQVQLPHWPQLLNELEAFEVTTTATGLMSYGASPGRHDDIVCALMLANSGLLRFGHSDFKIRYLEDLVDEPADFLEHPLMRYYEDMIEDDGPFPKPWGRF